MRSRRASTSSNNVWFLRTTDGAILEYSASEGADSNGANHGEVVNLYYSGENATIRYNRWRDSFIGTIGTALVAITAADGLEFYGNELVRFATGDGAIGFGAQASSGNRIYNNTFVDGTGFNSGMVFGAGTDNLSYNNLFVDCTTVRIEGDHDYNAFSDGADRGEANAQVNVPRSLLMNADAGDVRLTAPTQPGTTPGAPYDRDLDGDERGADGVADRGADERR